MTVRAAWLTTRGDAAGGQTRNDSRLTPITAMTPAGTLTTQPGVIPGGNPFALAATGAMTATLGTGRALIQGNEIQGAYPVSVTAPETLTFIDGDPANPRIDLVVLRIYDAAHDNTGQVRAAAEIIPGTPSAAPTPPPLPAGALGLYRVAVPAKTSAGTGGIDFPTATTDVRRYTAAVGGIVPQPDAAGAYRGQYRDDGTAPQRFDGTAWRPVVERHYAQVVKGDHYNLPANTYVSVMWDGVRAASEPAVWTTARPSRLTAPVPGLYQITAQHTWPEGARDARVRIIRNGGDSEWQLTYTAASGGAQGHGGSIGAYLGAGDYIEMQLYTATRITDVPGYYTNLSMFWIGA
ncbi:MULTISPECIES: hypothetical protein [unclassified Streptomyces]|uniref:hypothetical protein n=1 Tax=unclassified Streptomyces TaxID=2593676 RepID=UPI000380584E|nr:MULTISPECIES: hypothetical protein [unclassified Streptomyces]MYT30462.1 hypothetical protein [Streptomyces sp. SID8354]